MFAVNKRQVADTVSSKECKAKHRSQGSVIPFSFYFACCQMHCTIG